MEVRIRPLLTFRPFTAEFLLLVPLLKKLSTENPVVLMLLEAPMSAMLLSFWNRVIKALAS